MANIPHGIPQNFPVRKMSSSSSISGDNTQVNSFHAPPIGKTVTRQAAPAGTITNMEKLKAGLSNFFKKLTNAVVDSVIIGGAILGAIVCAACFVAATTVCGAFPGAILSALTGNPFFLFLGAGAGAVFGVTTIVAKILDNS